MGLTVEKCIQAWSNSLKQLNVRADIVFFGDSLTYYGDFSSVFSDKVVCNLGLRGDTIQGMIDRVEQVKILEPKVVYLMAGINDVTNSSLSVFKSLYEELLRRFKSDNPGVDMIIQSLLPVNNEEFPISCDNNQVRSCNEVILKSAGNFKYKYVDLFSLYVENGKLPTSITFDGIHLKKDGYYKWYNKLKDIV